MEVRIVHPDRTLIELTTEERDRLMGAVARIQQTFIATAPILRQMGLKITEAAESFERLQSACQKLDPAFADPSTEEESFPFHYLARPEELGGTNP